MIKESRFFLFGKGGFLVYGFPSIVVTTADIDGVSSF